MSWERMQNLKSLPLPPPTVILESSSTLNLILLSAGILEIKGQLAVGEREEGKQSGWCMGRKEVIISYDKEMKSVTLTLSPHPVPADLVKYNIALSKS